MRAMFLMLAIVLAACATPPPPPIVQTPSGRPEAIFVGADPEDVRSRLAGLCLNDRMFVVEQSPQVVCGRVLQGGDAIIARLAIGNSYSTTPEVRVRFAVIQTGPDVRVQAYQWVQTQLPFGQMQTAEMNDPAQFNAIQLLLHSIGGTDP